MDYATAKDNIWRKLTNYRYAKNETGGADADERIAAYRAAASALVDFKSQHKGKELFKSEMQQQIIAYRNKIKTENSQISMIGAYQMAVKHLWDKEDHQRWDELAAASATDVYKYVFVRFVAKLIV
jgi:hypothetical protein